MMQAILPLSPAPASSAKIDAEANTVEEIDSVEGQEGDQKSATRFSDLLDGMIEAENPEDTVDELLSAEDELLDVEVQPEIDSLEGIDDETVVEALEADEQLDAEPLLLGTDEELEQDLDAEDLEDLPRSNNDSTMSSTEEDLQPHQTKPAENELSQKQQDMVDKDPQNTVIKADNINAEGAVQTSEEQAPVNPILAQIETAKNTNTKVTEHKPLGNVEVLVNGGGRAKKTEKEGPSEADKNSRLNPENVLSDDELTDDFLKQSSTNSDKLESMMAGLKGEGEKPLFNQAQDTNVLRPVALTSALNDRLASPTSQIVNNNVTLTQSALLQQPIELQSKHASALIGERIMMMIGQGKQEVSIRLDPAELGSMHIKLQVQQDQLQVAIQTQVGQSRDIIEQNLPRLREQLAQQGINLGEASVEQRSSQQQSQSDKGQQKVVSEQRNSNSESILSNEQSEWVASQIPLSPQGIDYYA
ncbi:hypothetical protein CW745_05830 [Psychromonas sp. psych-6C06]|uniref:flagellar hook-length control protein FliK n=1 Tax=Psychromonas sp. psych-6C06 TaxID=2058089 RepID=UPI000C3478C0|nr:flagellar hook-length control protein FliK [Psychromonas sp. psych-6C06]PKF62942.1 hypothetical protein CW745_05830 [Psychromonas sp. psych-6C06]